MFDSCALRCLSISNHGRVRNLKLTPFPNVGLGPTYPARIFLFVLVAWQFQHVFEENRQPFYRKVVSHIFVGASKKYISNCVPSPGCMPVTTRIINWFSWYHFLLAQLFTKKTEASSSSIVNLVGCKVFSTSNYLSLPLGHPDPLKNNGLFDRGSDPTIIEKKSFPHLLMVSRESLQTTIDWKNPFKTYSGSESGCFCWYSGRWYITVDT